MARSGRPLAELAAAVTLLPQVLVNVRAERARASAPEVIAAVAAEGGLLAGQGRLSPWGLLPAIVILLREILVSGLREYLAGLRIGLPVTELAKWKTGFQMGALGTLLAGDDAAVLLHLQFLPVSLIGEAMLWVAAGLTLWTGWDYLHAGLRHASAPGAPVRRP